MIDRNLLVVAGVSLLLTGPRVFALGVGDLRVQSELNQPFVGEITLYDVAAANLDGVSVSLAPVAEFDAAGVERYHHLTGLRFTPLLGTDGQTVVQVTSRDPIKEPYLDFLVRVAWASGQLTKQFTVLLNPPSTRTAAGGLSGRTVARAAGAGSPGAAAHQAPPSPLPPMRPGRIPEGAEARFPLRIRPVRRGDTLSSLARAHLPPETTAPQMIMALYRSNQQAFTRGDINRLKLGQALTVPSATEMYALDPDSARVAYREALQGRPLRRLPRTTPASIPVASGPPVADTASRTGAREAELESQLRDLRRQLQERDRQLAEALARPGMLGNPLLSVAPPVESDDMPSRLAAEPSALEASIADTGPATESSAAQPGLISEPPVPDDEGMVPIAESPQPSAADADAAAEQLSEPQQPGSNEPGLLPVPEPEPAASAPAPVTAPATIEPRVAVVASNDSASGSPLKWFMLVVLPLCLAALGGLWYFRRRQAEAEAAAADALAEVEFDHAEQTNNDTTFFPREVTQQAPEPPDADSSLEPDSATASDLNTALSDFSAAPDSAASARGAEDGDTLDGFSEFLVRDNETSRFESDLISETDIYLAYGKHDIARKRLEAALAANPEQDTLRLKLAEVYAAAGERQVLDQLVEQMRGRGLPQTDPAAWQRLLGLQGEPDAASEPAGSGGSPAAVTPEVTALPFTNPTEPAAASLTVEQDDDEDLLGDLLKPDSQPLEFQDLEIDLTDTEIADSQLGAVLDSARDTPLATELALGTDEESPDGLELDVSGEVDQDAQASANNSTAESVAADVASAESDALSLDWDPTPEPEAAFDSEPELDASAPPVPPSSPESLDSLAGEFAALQSADPVSGDDLVDLEHSADILADWQAPDSKTNPGLEASIDSALPGRLSEDAPAEPVIADETMEAVASPDSLEALFVDLDSVTPDPAASSAELEADGLDVDAPPQWQPDTSVFDDVATKIDLARAYLEMADRAAAREILEEVLAEGREEQRGEAQALLDEMR